MKLDKFTLLGLLGFAVIASFILYFIVPILIVYLIK